MKFIEFATLRKRELFQFCRARFGRHWRRTVTHQLGIHPRTFERWMHGPAVPRHLPKVESWARSIGFTSPSDADIHAALRESGRFQRLASRQTARAKKRAERKIPASNADKPEVPDWHAAMLEALNNPKATFTKAL